MTMLSTLTKLFTVLALTCAGVANADTIKPLGEGLPLPWPFPWAKECPVDWQRMAGRYVLSDSINDEQIDLKITVVTSPGFRLVQLSRYDRSGRIIAHGFSFVSLNQRMLRMKLVLHNSTDVSTDSGSASIKLHYSDWNLGCAEDHLVPILTFERSNSSTKSTNHYRLVRIPSKEN